MKQKKRGRKLTTSLKLSIHGNPSGYSGPAIHCQEFCRCLDKVGAEIKISGNTPINWRQVPVDIQAMEYPQVGDKPITISLESPIFWWRHLADRRKAFIGYIVFEGDMIPFEWATACIQDEVDEIWCPSNHTKYAILEGVRFFFNKDIDEKVKVIPHGYCPNIFKPKGKKASLYKDDKFTFLYLGGWSQGFADRKGLDIAYKAFRNEFKKTEDVKFVFKITGIYNRPGYKPISILKSIKTKYKPECSAIMQDVKRDWLPAIYRGADVFLYPSKAEGFGMTALESMACGTPVMSSCFGGQTDFINKSNGWIISRGEKAWATDPYHIYDFAKWFVTDWQEWAKQMRYVFENQAEVKRKRKKALGTVKKFTWKNTAKLALKEVEKYV
jgi:glycosyltransferase involved in cell wall biosynthesis